MKNHRLNESLNGKYFRGKATIWVKVTGFSPVLPR